MNFFSSINAVMFGISLHGMAFGADDFQKSILPC